MSEVQLGPEGNGFLGYHWLVSGVLGFNNVEHTLDLAFLFLKNGLCDLDIWNITTVFLQWLDYFLAHVQMIAI